MKRTLCPLLLVLLSLLAAALAEPAPAAQGACPGLAVADGLIWQIADGDILCQQPETGETVASAGISSLIEPQETLVYQGITSWSADSALLVSGLSAKAGVRRVALMELAVGDGAISVRNAWDASEKLGFLFGDGAEWLEVDPVACGQGLFIAAMDAQYRFHFLLYAPETDALTPLGERPIEAFQAAVPYRGGVLLAGPNALDDALLELTFLDPADGTARLLRVAAVDSAQRLFNFAYSEAEDRLYYTLNSTVFALEPTGEAAPEPIGATDALPAELRLGVVTKDYYAAHAQQPGLLERCALRGRAETVALRVLNPAGEEIVNAAAGDFGVANPGYVVSVTQSGDEADALAGLQGGGADFDACVIRLNGETYRAMRSAGLLADLSGSASLRQAVAAMPARLRASLSHEGTPVACPVSVSNACQLLNVSALQALTGRSRDDLPTDWAGFFGVLKQLGDQGVLIGNESYRLCDGELPAEGLRETLFSWMLLDCFLWLDEDPGRADGLSEALCPVLEAFDAVPWNRLGLPEAADAAYGTLGGAIQAAEDGGPSPLIMDGMVEIAVSPMPEGCEFWPLSLRPGDERLIAQYLSVLCLNANSPRLRAATAFAGALWDDLDPATKASLCDGMDAPALNPDYEDDLAYLEQTAEAIRQAMDAAPDAAGKAQMAAELAELEAYLEDYRENARWLLTEESVARYREQSERMLPTASDAWFSEAVASAMYDFLDGLLTPEGFAQALREAL